MNPVLSSIVAGLSRTEKLQLMEELWESLADLSNKVEILASHEVELMLREQKIADGRSTFSDWEEAKQRRSSDPLLHHHLGKGPDVGLEEDEDADEDGEE